MTSREKRQQRLADLSERIASAESRGAELRLQPPSAARDEMLVLNEQTVLVLRHSKTLVDIAAAQDDDA
ncbi:MAG: hypothetical protein V4773_17445 [Verrucomicrobiota bacterium]